MAILDDEEYPSSSPFAGSERQLSALEGGTYDTSAGADEEIPPTSADISYAQTALPRTTARSPRLQARVEETQRLLEQRRAATGGDETSTMRAIAADPRAMAKFNAEALANPEQFEMEPPPPPPKEEAGWGQIFSRGLLRANEAVMQGKDIAEGKQPRESKTPREDYEEPLVLQDFGSPITAAKKLWLSLAQSYPAVAAGIAGSLVGGAAGSLAGPVGTAVGGALGGAAGMGGASGFMAIGPAYQAEYQALGENPSPEAIDAAWERAKVTAEKEAGVGFFSGALFLAGKPASNALKAILTPVVAGAEKPVAGVPLRSAVQAVGQPAITVGGQVTENVVRGDPLSTHLNEAAAAGIANVAPDVAMAVGGRVARRVLGGRQGEVTPGVTDEQKLALDAASKTTPAGPGGTPLGPEPTPARPTPPPFEAPPAPPGTGPGGMPLGEGPAGPGGAGMPPRPPGGGPGGTPMGPEPTPGAPVYPVGPTPAGVGGTPLGPEPTPAPPPVPPRPAGGPGGMPLEPEPVPVRPTEVPPEPPSPLPPPPGAGPGGMPPMDQPTPPPRPTGPTPPGIGGTPLGPEPRPAPPPAPEPPPRRPQPPGPGGTPLPEEATGLTIERDHLDPSRVVAKRGEDVVGKGATPEQATQDAALRQGAPYRDEGVGFTTERGSTYEIHDDGTTTRNKSYHPEHGAEDVGPKPRSARTIYVDSQADAANLSGAGVSGAFGHRLVLNPDGTATLAWKTRPDAKWGTHDNNRNIPFSTEPGVGKHPVEMWGKTTDVPGAAEAYSGQHAGNKIVEMRGKPVAPEATAQPRTEAGGTWRAVRPGEIFQPGGRFRVDVVTGAQEVFERAPPARAARPEPAARGRDAASETPKEQTFRLPKTGHELTGKLGTGTVDPARPFVLSWRRNLLDAQGRPVRGASHTFTYADEASARTDLEAVRAAGGQDAMLREFSQDLSTARDITEGKAAADTKLSREQIVDRLTELGATKAEISSARRKNIVNARNDLAQKEASVAAAAEVKAKGEARAKPETVTKPAEELHTETRPETEEGARTKSGAYVTPGEAAESQAPRPVRAQPTEMQQGARAESAQHTTQSSHTIARRMAPEPAEPFHVPEGLNTERTAGHVVENIIKGQKLEDAVAAFGSKEEGSVGRPRKVKSLSSYIRDFLREAESNTAEQQRKRAMDEAVAKLRKLPPEPNPSEASPARRKILNDVDRLLKQQEEVRANRALLEDAADKIEAIERGDKVTGPASVRGRVREMGRAAQRLAATYFAGRPEVNEAVVRGIEQAGEHGARLHDLLDALSGHAIADRLTPQMTELARVLRRVLPNVEVHEGAGRMADPNVAALYEPTQRRIYLDTEARTPAVNLLHEGIHTGTFDYINHLYQTPEINLNPRELAHKSALNAIRNEVGRVLDEGGLSAAEHGELLYALNEAVDPRLNMAGPHELATQLLSTPEVYDVLSRTTASPEFRSALDRVGMGVSAKASIWDGFKKIIRNIFGVPDRLDSVFDHVLRPLTEILEEGSRFRRPQDATAIRETIRNNNEVLGPARLRDNASLQRLGRTAKDIADRGIVKTAMRGAFQSATTTAIRDFIKNDVPSAVSHLEYLRKITAASEEERVRKVVTHGPNGEVREEANIDKARRLHQELKTVPDAPEVNKLMTEVTQAEMSVIDPRRNAHLTTDAQLRQQEAFQARFDALDPRAQQTYREVNEYHNEIYRAEREAKVKNLVDIAFGDRSETDKQALREQMRTKQGVLDVLNNPDATPAAKVLGRDWDNKKDLVRLIAESQEGGFVDGDYFPSRRHGEYVVSAGEHNKPGYLVQMFETQSAARVFRDELIRNGRTDVSQVFVKSRSRPRDLVSVAALSTLDKAMERAGLTGDAADVMRDMYAGIMIQHGTRLAERTMRREGIAGASVDQARNILGDFLAYTSRIGHLMHGADAARTLYAAEKEASTLHKAGSGAGEQRVANAQLGVEELRNRMSPGDGDRSADIMGTGTRRLTTLTVLNTLLRPAHFFMQLAGTHAASTSLIAARHGYLSSVGAVNRAYAQLAGTAGSAAGRNAMAAIRQELRAANWDLADMYRRRLSRANSGIAPDHADLLIDRLNQAGLINHTWIREIQRLAGPQGFGDSKFNFVSRFLDVSSVGEHAIDSMMRVGTAKAAFELEYRKNGGHLNDALDYAMQMAERSQPDYTMHNKARIATVQSSLGRLAPLTTQFRQFGLHMYGVQGNLLAEGVRGAKGSAERAEAYKAIAYLQASHAMVWSGVGTAVFGSLPMMAGLGLYDLLNPNDPTNRAHTNREMETASRNWVRNITGSKTAADIFAHGIPMAFGLNVSRSLQFTNLLSPPELNSFNRPDVLSFLAQAITGASSDTAAGMVEGMSRIVGGDISKETVAKILPRIARDPLEAIVWGEQGLKTHKGDLTIVPPEKFSTADLVAKGLGFIPETSSTARDARAAINLRELTHRDITGSIIDRLVKAAPNERKAVLAEITRYNASVDPADRITGQQIQSRLREQARINAMPEHFGMRLPRREYGKIAEITAFAR